MAYRRRTLEMQANQIEAVLAQHKVPGHVRGGTVTPRFVRFEIVTEVGAKISKVTGLADEIALALDMRQARVFRDGGSIQVEVPRSQADPVRLLPLCEQLQRVPSVTAVLGLEQTGAPLLLRLSSPDVAHVLIVGTTGSGKTALARTLLASLAMYNRQSQVQLVLVDPKGDDYSRYRGATMLTPNRGEFRQVVRLELGLAVGGGELRRVKRPAGDLEFLLRVVDLFHFVKAGDDGGDRFANLARAFHAAPIDRPIAGKHAISDGRNDFHFALWSRVASWAAVAVAHVVEHRLSRGGLRLLISGEYGQNQRLFRQTMRMAGIESGVEIAHHFETG